jgi:hypothetical protein
MSYEALYSALSRVGERLKVLRRDVDRLDRMQFLDVSGVMVQESDGRMGLESGAGTSVAGANTVINTSRVTADSRVFLTVQGNITGVVPTFHVTARMPGASFTITGYVASGTGSADVAWLIVEPV